MWKRYTHNNNVTFSLLYGSSTAGIAKQLFMTTDEAQALVDMYFKTFPGVRKYIEGAHYMALNNQFVLTPFGQRKREYGTYQCFKKTAAYNAAMRNAQNVIIQSTTSTLGLIVFASLNEELKFRFGEDRVKCICTVYDSIEIECDQAIAAEVFEVCNYYMEEWPLEQFKWLQLPIGCEGDVGISWGETEVVHRGVTQYDIDAVIAKLKLTAEPI